MTKNRMEQLKGRQEPTRGGQNCLDDLDLGDSVLHDWNFDDLNLALKEEEERLRRKEMMMAFERGYLEEGICLLFLFRSEIYFL